MVALGASIEGVAQVWPGWRQGIKKAAQEDGSFNSFLHLFRLADAKQVKRGAQGIANHSDHK
jgi:hypothetical protein